MLNYDNVVDTVLHNALEENAWIRNRRKPDGLPACVVTHSGPMSGHNNRIRRGVRAEPETGLNFQRLNLNDACPLSVDRVCGV